MSNLVKDLKNMVGIQSKDTKQSVNADSAVGGGDAKSNNKADEFDVEKVLASLTLVSVDFKLNRMG